MSRKNGLKTKDFSALLAKVKGSDTEDIINHMVLRSLKQAKYSTTNIGHSAWHRKAIPISPPPIAGIPIWCPPSMREILTKSISAKEG